METNPDRAGVAAGIVKRPRLHHSARGVSTLPPTALTQAVKACAICGIRVASQTIDVPSCGLFLELLAGIENPVADIFSGPVVRGGVEKNLNQHNLWSSQNAFTDLASPPLASALPPRVGPANEALAGSEPQRRTHLECSVGPPDSRPRPEKVFASCLTCNRAMPKYNLVSTSMYGLKGLEGMGECLDRRSLFAY
ncbi:hypothetical protein CIRG_06158 [Coccidioides immitis RMSCC 2394]|uniref:Uncharacterized protein n=1 Tax=Coccidioides immitis RMSCC 2394 TaxID=404692 RepID=A0A0J6YHV3_COCIT|nr:hypothetical protein CIRG_06158 [Coccidioides immitis RMSCC 2394]